MRVNHATGVCLIKISIFALLCSSILAQKLKFGNCPSVEPMADIHLKRYMGLWYQYASLRPIWKILKKCVKFNYTAGKNGIFYVESSYKTIGNDIPTTHFGVATPEEYHGLPLEAGFNIKYFNWFRNATALTTQLYVLNTDYESYAVEYSCTEVLWLNIRRLQVLVRDPNVNTTVILRQVLKALEVEEIDYCFKYLKVTNQST